MRLRHLFLQLLDKQSITTAVVTGCGDMPAKIGRNTSHFVAMTCDGESICKDLSLMLIQSLEMTVPQIS